MPVAAWGIAILLAFASPGASFGLFIAALVVHVVVLAVFHPTLAQTRDRTKDLVLASEQDDPEFDRQGRRLRDRHSTPAPPRSTEDILRDMDYDQQYRRDHGGRNWYEGH
ncbi:hypothetical protein A5646_20475 [Mycobacterium sp. 1245499.0]|nr:hypothetical protein A5646_20475 [Mycobacterium sp. 1245499.0]